VISVALNIV